MLTLQKYPSIMEMGLLDHAVESGETCKMPYAAKSDPWQYPLFDENGLISYHGWHISVNDRAECISVV